MRCCFVYHFSCVSPANTLWRWWLSWHTHFGRDIPRRLFSQRREKAIIFSLEFNSQSILGSFILFDVSWFRLLLLTLPHFMTTSWMIMQRIQHDLLFTLRLRMTKKVSLLQEVTNYRLTRIGDQKRNLVRESFFSSSLDLKKQQWASPFVSLSLSLMIWRWRSLSVWFINSRLAISHDKASKMHALWFLVCSWLLALILSWLCICKEGSTSTTKHVQE